MAVQSQKMLQIGKKCGKKRIHINNKNFKIKAFYQKKLSNNFEENEEYLFIVLNIDEMVFRIFLLNLMIIFHTCNNKRNIELYGSHFNLAQYSIQKFDLYNPFLHDFINDSIARKEHPSHYNYDVYYTETGCAKYSYYRSESYGYLMEFKYHKNNKIKETIIYPFLANKLAENENIISNKYFYVNNKLNIYIDELNGLFAIIEDDSVRIYQGTLSSSSSFSIQKKKISDYNIQLLH